MVGRHELRLATGAPGGHDGAPGGIQGDLGPEILLHHVQAQIDTGGQARTGQHGATVDEQDRWVDVDLRVAGLEGGGGTPVRGGGQAAQQADLGKGERAHADRRGRKVGK